MQLHNIKDLIVNHQPKADSPELDLEVVAIYCASVSGFIVSVKLNGVTIVVSSKRQTRRVFKSIDSLRNTLSQNEIHSFSVVG